MNQKKIEEKLIKAYHDYNKKSHFKSEFDIRSVINRFIAENKIETLSTELKAERMAFNFTHNLLCENEDWQTYYGPIFIGTNDAGEQVEYPSIKAITQDIISYWKKRANEETINLLKGRYADLVWTFSRIVCVGSPEVDFPRIAIDAFIVLPNNDNGEEPINVIALLGRALSLSMSINDESRIEISKQAILNYEQKVAIDDKPGLWGFVYQLLIDNSKVNLTQIEESGIINRIENRLTNLTNPDHASFSPWAAEISADFLARYYRKKSMTTDMKRVLLAYSAAFEHQSLKGAPLQVSVWLQKVYAVLKSFGLEQEATEILKKIQTNAPKISDDMQEIKVKANISQEEFDHYINWFIEKDLDLALRRVVVNFIPKKEDVVKQLLKMSEESPLYSIANVQIQDYKGRTLATLGNLQNDLEGNVAHQMTRDLGFESAFLNQIFKAIENKFEFTVENLLNYLYKVSIYTPERKDIIKSAIVEYFNKNYLQFIHLSIPQIEEIFKGLIEKCKGSVLIPNKHGGFHFKTLDALLRDPIIEKVFGEDVSLYFRVVLTDPRGLNIRNDVCHGLMPLENFNAVIANRLLHILLCLSSVK
ncbi:MAG: DUF4209 domain-containing protein, partial [Candidatus Zapsychrus exili]|nr:DUF4209 domain-containing protein [Candidatus Zapsychrus exili]